MVKTPRIKSALRRIYREKSILWVTLPIAHHLAVRGNLSTAQKILCFGLSIRPADTDLAYALGSLMALRGKLPEAKKLFQQDLPVPTGLGTHTFTRALCFDVAGTMCRSRVVSFDPPTADRSRSAIYFVSADSGYFSTFIDDLVISVRRNSPQLHIHAHIVNPDENARASIERLRRDEVSFSTEQTDLSELNDEQIKTYYAVSRYLMLPRIRRAFGGPMIVADMDQIIVADVAPLLNCVSEHDLSIIQLAENSFNLLSYFTATAIALKDSSKAAAFADALAANIRSALSDDRNLVWHLDQGALVMTLLGDRTIAFNPMSRHLINFGNDPNDTSVLWSATRSVAGNSQRSWSAGWQKHVNAPTAGSA